MSSSKFFKLNALFVSALVIGLFGFSFSENNSNDQIESADVQTEVLAYTIIDHDGKCGEGKEEEKKENSEKKEEAKKGEKKSEAKKSGEKKEGEKEGEEAKCGEGKCGEGKCGGSE